MGPLTPYRQVATMTKPPEATEIDVPLDVERDLSTHRFGAVRIPVGVDRSSRNLKGFAARLGHCEYRIVKHRLRRAPNVKANTDAQRNTVFQVRYDASTYKIVLYLLAQFRIAERDVAR